MRSSEPVTETSAEDDGTRTEIADPVSVHRPSRVQKWLWAASAVLATVAVVAVPNPAAFLSVLALPFVLSAALGLFIRSRGARAGSRPTFWKAWVLPLLGGAFAFLVIIVVMGVVIQRTTSGAAANSGQRESSPAFDEMHRAALARMEREAISARAAATPYLGMPVEFVAAADDSDAGRNCVLVAMDSYRVMACPSADLDILKWLMAFQENGGKRFSLVGVVAGTQDDPSLSPLVVRVSSYRLVPTH